VVEEEEEGRQEQEEETEEERVWNKFLDEKRQEGTSDETLDSFVQGQKRWEASVRKLATSLDECVPGMNDLLEHVIHRLAEPILAQRREKIAREEEECKKILLENHHKRNKMIKTLQKSDKAWKEAYKGLVAKVEDEAQPASEDSCEDGDEGSSTVSLVWTSR
jgi:hypothetical protein